MSVVKSIVETVDGKKFELEHEDTVSDDVLSKYVQQVAYPMAAAEEDGPFDFIVDSLFSGSGSVLEGFETSAEGFQQFAANQARHYVNVYYNTVETGARIGGNLDAENAERLKVAREKALRGVNQYEDVGVMMREPIRNLAKNIKDARFLQQDTAAANVALEVVDTVAKMAPILGSAFTTKNVASVLPTMTAAAQSISEAKSDMEYALDKKQEDFTLEERQTLATVSTTYAAGSALLFKTIASPALGLDKASGELLRKFLKGEVKMPAGKLKSLLNVVRAGGGEMIEETAQGQFLDTLAAFSYDDDRQLVGKEVLNKRMHEAMIAFLAGGSIRTVGEVGGAIGNIRLPEPKTQELSEEQQKGVKTFKVKYTTTEKERGRQDKVFDREDTFEAKTLEEAQQIIDESVKKKPGVDAESIVIEEVQPTVEPEVKEDVDFIPDYSDAKVGDTIKVFSVDGKESDVEVTGISDAGTIKYKRADGTEGILGSETDAVLYDINSSNYETQGRNTGFSNRKLSDMSDAELEQLSNKIDEDFKSGAVPTDTNQGPVRDRIADRNAVKLEQKRRKQKPVDTVDPQKTGAEIPLGVFGDVDLDTVPGLTPQQKKKITELRQEANAEARKIFGALDDPTGELDTQAIEEGLEALRQISEEGTVGATAQQKQFFDKIRDIERRQAEILGREYIPRTDASIVREVRDTIVRTPLERATPTFFVGATMSPVSSQFDSSRTGTSKKGTKARPVATTQEDNINSEIVPDTLLEKQMGKVDYQHLPESIKNETDPKAKYEKFVEYIKNNLIALHNKFPEDLRAQATLWYDGARKIAENLAQRYNLTEEQVGGILAVLSPQKQWFMNIAQAEQVIHTMKFYQDFKIEGADIDSEIENIIQGVEKKGQADRRKILNKVKGKTIKQLRKESDYLAGWAIRLISQAKYGRYYNVVNPDGTILGFDSKKDGSPQKNSWGAIVEIEKAMSILDNGSLDNISEKLGDKHKVRNFYNNIVAPNSPYGDATIDTHAVAAGLLMPLGANAIEVKHNFGTLMPGAPASGISGIYHMYLEAYRRAAKELGIQPRQMQSITWEAIRLLYPSELRTKDSIDKATKIHNNANNEQEARDTLLRPEIPRPSWSTTGDIRELTTVPAAAENLGSDNVLGGDLQFRGRQPQRDAVVGTTDQQGKTDAQRSIIDTVIADIQKLAQKLGVKIEANTTINRPAQYNYETQTIQYNPQLLASRGKDFTKAAMREEVIHAAMHQVIMKRNPKLSAKAAFEKVMSSIGSDLTQEQKDLMAEAYGDLGTDLNYGAEYTRFAVQHILDGKTTEGTLFGGKAYQKLKSLIKSVQSYVSRIMGPELKANEEAAFIIADTIRLLRSVDPDTKPTQQKIVDKALAIASGTEQADTFAYTNPYASEADRKKIKSEKNRRTLAAVLQTASSFFKNINMEIHNVLSAYFNRIERRQNDASRQILNFQKKIRGIKNKKDSVRLKQLLTATADPNTKEGKKIYNERDALLRKYNLYNDFKLLVRPLLDNLRLDAIESNLPVKYLFEYYPRVVKDLGGLLNLYGKDIRNDFTAHIEKINDKRRNSKPKKLELNTDEVAAEFIVYLNNKMYNQNLGEKVPGFLKKRKSGILTQEELKFYEEPEVALGRYVNSIIVKSEQARLFGNKALERDEEILLDTGKIHRINLSDPTGELSRVVGRLYSEGKLSERQMSDLLFGLDQLFGPPIPGKEQESNLRQYGRIATYGTLLVDPTTTLSQLYDLAFMALDNRLRDIAGTVFGKKEFTLEMAGIDPSLASAEFRPNDSARLKFIEKLTKNMLRSVGFTQLDALMKETNLTVNYNRYRKLSKLSPNSKKFKKFRSEVEFMVGKEDADRTINDFKNGVYDSPYVRELVVRKLLETQPVTVFEMPMAIRKNPNLRMWYTMKSFIIKQANLINDRMISKILSKTSSNEEKRKAFMELFKLIFLFQLVGFPIDFLKDMFAGRDVYPEDYVENGFLRMFGLSKYNIYEFKTRGAGFALLNFVAPVPIAQGLVFSNEIFKTTGKIISGEVETDDFKKLGRELLPYDSLWYYRYGPGQEAQKKKQKRELKDSTSIIESLIQFPSGRQEGRRPMIRAGEPIGADISDISDIIPYLRNI